MEQVCNEKQMKHIVKASLSMSDVIQEMLKGAIASYCIENNCKKVHWDIAELMLVGAINEIIEDVSDKMGWDYKKVAERFCSSLTEMVCSLSEKKENNNDNNNIKDEENEDKEN